MVVEGEVFMLRDWYVRGPVGKERRPSASLDRTSCHLFCVILTQVHEQHQKLLATEPAEKGGRRILGKVRSHID